jgi:hypothetical protein
VFSWLVEWIYLDHTHILLEEDGIMQRVELYCLACKYRVTALMDKLMNSIHDSVRDQRGLLDLSAMDYVYRNCAGSCGLKRFIAELFVYCIVETWDGTEQLKGTPEISIKERVKLVRDHEELHFAIFDILGSSGRRSMSTEECSLKMMDCEFHEHAEDGRCRLKDQYTKNGRSFNMSSV